MKGLTIWQPRATLVVIGAKPFETRTVRPPHGLIGQRIAIHAAVRPFRPATDVDVPTYHEMMRALDRAGLRIDELPLGALVGTARLVKAEKVDHAHEFARLPPDRFGDYSVGRWVWFLDQVQQLPEPVEFRGAQGWFHVPDSLVAAARSAEVLP